MSILLGLLIILTQYLDCLTTEIGLRLGAAEANALSGYLIENYGHTGFLAIKLAAGVLFAVGVRKNPYAGAALVLLYTAIVAWNLHVILGLAPHP